MYGEFAQFYDLFEGDTPKTFAHWIVSRATAHHIDVRSVLELGCGTGSVLQLLPASWVKTGVDVSAAMLEQARRKRIDATLIEADLTHLSLPQRFDLVVCVFDTINHLPTVDSWPLAFRVARSHLRPNGLFMFDMNTVGRMRALAAGQPWVRDSDGNTLIMNVSDTGPNRFDWDIRVFEHLADDTFQLHREVLQHTVPRLAEVASMLPDEGLELLEARADDNQATDDSPRAFLVCRPR